MTMPDPRVTAVLFKDEDEVNGEIVGPVWLQYNDDSLKPASPESQWYTLREAREIAARHGLELTET